MMKMRFDIHAHPQRCIVVDMINKKLCCRWQTARCV